MSERGSLLERYVGKVVNVEAAGIYSASGCLRHPGLKGVREDLRAEDCTLERALSEAEVVIRSKGAR